MRQEGIPSVVTTVRTLLCDDLCCRCLTVGTIEQIPMHVKDRFPLLSYSARQRLVGQESTSEADSGSISQQGAVMFRATKVHVWSKIVQTFLHK